MKHLVIGIDSSTTATKAIAWRRNGTIAATGRSTIPLSSPAKDHYEQDPEDWWRSTCAALKQLFENVSPHDIAAVAISNQRETFVPLAEDGSPVRPAIIWLDQRCKDEVPWLTERVGAERIHHITGKPPDVAPVAYRIAWMLRHEPELFRKTRIFADVHAYLTFRLTGLFRTSWPSADSLGLFDMQQKQWSEPILAALEISKHQLPEPHAPGTMLGEVTPQAAAECGLTPGTPVVAGGGDGQAAGLGVNALTSARAYLNLGTAVVAGIYSTQYRTGNAWRTMGSCSGHGYYYETSLRAGAFLLDWFAKTFAGVPSAEVFQKLEAEASQAPIGCDGLIALPYWGAVMTPYWDSHARGCFIGLTAFHQRAHMYRALLEGIALEQALVTQMIEEQTGVEVKELIAIGGGASSDLWCQILADTSGKLIRRSATIEASSLGAAMCAAVAAQWFPKFEDAAQSMAGAIVKETSPIASNQSRYADLFSIYRDLYPALRPTFGKLSGFSAPPRSPL